MTTATAPIIDQPERQGSARRTGYGVITAIAWTAYAYLWLPLLTLFAWLLGFRSAYSQLYLRDNAVDPFLVLSLPLIALACAVVLLGWAEYNRIRFQREDKRLAPELVGFDAVDASLGASAEIGERLRSGRVLLVSMNDSAHPTTVNRLD